MMRRLSGMLADALVGLVVVGLGAGLLGPVLGPNAGALLLMLAFTGVVAAVIVGQWIRLRLSR